MRLALSVKCGQAREVATCNLLMPLTMLITIAFNYCFCRLQCLTLHQCHSLARRGHILSVHWLFSCLKAAFCMLGKRGILKCSTLRLNVIVFTHITCMTCLFIADLLACMVGWTGIWRIIKYKRFEFFTAVRTVTFLWVLAPCSLVGRYRRFGETYCVPQPWRRRQFVSPKRWCRLVGSCQRFEETYISISIFDPEGGDSMFLRNVGSYRRVYTAPKPRRTRLARKYTLKSVCGLEDASKIDNFVDWEWTGRIIIKCLLSKVDCGDMKWKELTTIV
jgi:hypothetical protein